jgi:Flp pilus assembly protein TadD
LIVKQDFVNAENRLHKAIAIYPEYASAYNSRAVIYAHRGDSVHEREALQKAVSIDDHFALAYVNLGRMDFRAGDFPNAEAALNKAARLDPVEPLTLVLLGCAQLMNQHFEEVIATSRKAHALEKPHALAHRLAANAFEQKQQPASAIEELEQFLAEEPTGRRADEVRRELEMVLAVTR